MANEVRVGLVEQPQDSSLDTKQRSVKHPLDEPFFGRPVRVHVKEFGVLFGTIALAVGAKFLYDDTAVATWGTWCAIGFIFAALGFWAPQVLHPLWRGWMKLAHYLSIVMTSVILGLIWTIGFIPMAALLKVLRIKVMDLSYRTNVDTYWETRDTKYDDFKRLEQQF